MKGETIMCSKNELKALVDKYVKLKTQENQISKQTKELNNSIKKTMLDLKLTELEGNEGAVTLTKREKPEFDEVKVIEFLKENNIQRGIVKKKEYIDYDALESALYREKFDKDIVEQMDSYKIVKVTNVLNIK
jgi:hypothetical protein